MKKFDVFVFGTGTAGKYVADQCAQNGKKVGIIDNRDYGGTCSQRGCDPKKLMLASMEAYEFGKNMKGDGIKNVPEIDFNAAHRYAKRYVSDIPSNTEEMLKNDGVACYHGEAHFVDEHTIELDGEKIQSDVFVIATGLKTRPLGIPGEEYALTSGDFFGLQEPPKTVVFIGAGYIGMEFSHMLNRSGSKVTILERDDQIMKPFEAFTANMLDTASTEQGINILKNAQVSSIEKKGDRFVVNYAMDDGTHQITFDTVFNTAGRVPSIDVLQLENANVVTTTAGVQVNHYLQSTSQSHFYACGDVSSKNLPLTPLSGKEAKVVTRNILNKKEKFDFPVIPSVAFTIPNCGGIGMTEIEAENAGLHFDVIERDASDWFNNQRINAQYYAFKILVEKETDKILGTHILGQEAAEQLNMFAIAMKADLKWSDLKDTIFTYPSWGNDILSM
ncbi:MAG: NAD(P)/FAD-dependent oxidoreductase [Nonlabens sp.]